MFVETPTPTVVTATATVMSAKHQNLLTPFASKQSPRPTRHGPPGGHAAVAWPRPDRLVTSVTVSSEE